MRYSLLIHTVRYLRIKQIIYQLKYRMVTSKIKDSKGVVCGSNMNVSPPIFRNKVLVEKKISFLNQSTVFNSWNDASFGMLWVYNLNYMDWLQQKDMSVEEGIRWIDKFIAELPTNRIGLDPYPIALRGINWIKFMSQHFDEIEEARRTVWNNSLYAQYLLLNKKLEYHLLGNHLLEDAYSLFIAAIYFKDKGFYKKSIKLLRQELTEQILSDGAHYEQSPMYHCILLDRLLDCYNFSINNLCREGQENFNDFLKEKAVQMLGHLNCIIYADGQIPLLNDSAIGIAPTSAQLFDYAKRLGLKWDMIAMTECGYRKMKNQWMEAIVDIGNITASYQPGHSHADTFNYELLIDGHPFIVDTGISTYDKTRRRQLERSTKAHNTVSVDELDSSEVWGGFRVGRRAKVELLTDSGSTLKAVHNGFGKAGMHTRSFVIDNDSFTIHDMISTDYSAVSYIHFAPEVCILSVCQDEVHTNRAIIRFSGALSIELKEGKISTEYNKFQPSLIARIRFTKNCKYTILYNNR